MKNMNAMEDLESIRKRLNRLVCFANISGSILVLIAIAIFITGCINTAIANILLIPLIVIIVVFMVDVFIGLETESLYLSKIKSYIFERIKNIFHEQGIESENYKIIARESNKYDVAFHNKAVDYDKLQTEIAQLLEDMNSKFETKISIRLL